MCRAPKSVHEVEGEEENAIFLGSITTDGEPWTVNIGIHDSSVMFKIDTGADVTVLPHAVFLEIYENNPPILRKSTKPLLGPGRSPLDVVGVARLLLRRGGKAKMEDVYVVRHLHTALLGRSCWAGCLPYGSTLNIEKCDLSKSEVSFLGHVVSASGISLDPGKTEAMKRMQEPTTVSELRSFLGMVNQLGKFIPQLAERDIPLRDLLSKKNCWMWGVEQTKAFQDLKDALTSPPVLAMYDPNRECKVSADASSYGLGGVLLQRWDEEWRPIAYMSRSLTPTEQRYAQVEKEALGLTWACERFCNFLIGKHFQLETDHKPLLSLLGSQALDALPPRLQLFRMRLMRYSYSISHVAGKCLWTVDKLSRAPVERGETPAEKELLKDTNIQTW